MHASPGISDLGRRGDRVIQRGGRGEEEMINPVLRKVSFTRLIASGLIRAPRVFAFFSTNPIAEGWRARITTDHDELTICPGFPSLKRYSNTSVEKARPKFLFASLSLLFFFFFFFRVASTTRSFSGIFSLYLGRTVLVDRTTNTPVVDKFNINYEILCITQASRLEIIPITTVFFRHYARAQLFSHTSLSFVLSS